MIGPQKVLVLGATGMLGRIVAGHLHELGYSVITHAHSGEADFRADLTEFSAARELMSSAAPDVIVNCAALADVDACEDDLNRAYRLNCRIVESVVQAISVPGLSVRLLHVSTDQVYDGPGLHNEDDVKITNAYAITKFAGDLAARAADSVVLRTNFFGRTDLQRKSSISDWLFKALKERQKIQLFEDVEFSPISFCTFCELLQTIFSRWRPGIYNLGTRSGLSKADFAEQLAGALGMQFRDPTRMKSSASGKLRAYRPKNMMMNVAKFESAFGLTLPTLTEEINVVAMEYKNA